MNLQLTKNSRRVANPVAQRVAGNGRELVHHLRQRLEIALARNQHVEHRVCKHRERGMRRALSHRARCVAATLPTCDDFSVSRLAWNPSPSATGIASSPRPAHFDDRRFERSKAQRAGARPDAEPLACTTTSGPSVADGSANGRRARAHEARCGLTSTSSTSPAIRPAIRPRGNRRPAPMTVTRSPTCGRASHIR